MRQTHLHLAAIGALAGCLGWLTLASAGTDQPAPKKTAAAKFKVTVIKGKADTAAPHAKAMAGHPAQHKLIKIAPLSTEQKHNLFSVTSASGFGKLTLRSKMLTISDSWWDDGKAQLWAYNPSDVTMGSAFFGSKDGNLTVSITTGNNMGASWLPIYAKRFLVAFKVQVNSSKSEQFEVKEKEGSYSEKVTLAPGPHHMTVGGDVADFPKSAFFILSCTSGGNWVSDGCEVTLSAD